MQTSNLYDTTNKIEMELDDIEYVLTDRQNVINPEDTTEGAHESNIVYADGSQTIVLQSGGKHYIQTLSGETYLLEGDTDSMEQLVVNVEENSEGCNRAIEVLQSEDDGKIVICNLTNTNNDIVSREPHMKRFKIGSTEYLTLDDDVETSQSTDSNEFGVLDETSSNESANFQYAILKDGKLHLQLCESNSVSLDNNIISEIQNNGDNITLHTDTSGSADVENKLQEYIIVNSNSLDECSENIHIAKTVTLHQYLNQMCHKVNKANGLKSEQHPGDENENICKSYEQFLNKKLLIRKNNGRTLFGKILYIKPASKTIDKVKLDIEQLQVVNILESQTISANNNDSSIKIQEGEDIDSIKYNYNITVEQINFISNTLHGLMEMPSVRKKLINHRLEIKLIDGRYSDENEDNIKEVQYISGIFTQDNGFQLDNSNKQRVIISLSIILGHDVNNQKITKVMFNERPIQCQICNRGFPSRMALTRHMHNCHSDKALLCNVCHNSFDHQILLNDHRKSNGHYFSCQFCSREFMTQGSLKRHQYIHSENAKKLQCIICKGQFGTVAGLSKHFLTHSQSKTCPCDTCGKPFPNYKDLTSHRKTHDLLKISYCYVCGRKFSRHSNLLRHMEIHKSDGHLHKCGICDCSYKFISSLTRHIVQNHMKQSP